MIQIWWRRSRTRCSSRRPPHSSYTRVGSHDRWPLGDLVRPRGGANRGISRSRSSSERPSHLVQTSLSSLRPPAEQNSFGTFSAYYFPTPASSSSRAPATRTVAPNPTYPAPRGPSVQNSRSNAKSVRIGVESPVRGWSKRARSGVVLPPCVNRRPKTPHIPHRSQLQC